MTLRVVGACATMDPPTPYMYDYVCTGIHVGVGVVGASMNRQMYLQPLGVGR